MARKLRYDWLLFVATFALISISVIMVYSASSFIALQKFGDSYYFLSKQVTFVLLGCLIVAVMMRVDYHVFEQPSVVWSLDRRVRARAALRLRRRRRGERRAPLVRHRRHRHPALRVREVRVGRVHRRPPRTPHGDASTTRRKCSCPSA